MGGGRSTGYPQAGSRPRSTTTRVYRKGMCDTFIEIKHRKNICITVLTIFFKNGTPQNIV